MVDQESVRRRLPASSWLGVGLLGVVVFLVGIYSPAFGRIPDVGTVQAVVAIAGGVVAVLGLTFWWDQRDEERRHPRRPPLTGHAREIGIAPSFEVYRPGPVERRPAPGEGAGPDRRR